MEFRPVTFSRYYNGITRRIWKHYGNLKRTIRLAVERTRLWRADPPALLDIQKAVSSLPENPTVLFLCLGNICRSPMAERYLRRVADERGISATVKSAGFLSMEGRKSPDLAKEVSQNYEVDLTDHRSTQVTQSQIESSDIVFLMDLNNVFNFRDEFGDHDHVYLLKAFSEDRSSVEVQDPHREDEDTFKTVYDEIRLAIDEFVAALDHDGN